MKRKTKGLIVVFTGDGKGKTTAAFGMAMRLIGHGKKVAVVQFLKSGSGECCAARKFGNFLKIWSYGNGFTWENTPAENKKIVQTAWQKCCELLCDPKYVCVVFDEINYGMAYKLLDSKRVIRELKKKPDAKHVILTGAPAPRDIIKIADLVTEMKCLKHPFQKGLFAQVGIEY